MKLQHITCYTGNKPLKKLRFFDYRQMLTRNSRMICYCTAKYSDLLYKHFMSLRFWWPAHISAFKWLFHICNVLLYNARISFRINKIPYSDWTRSRHKLCIQGKFFYFATRIGVFFSSVTLPQQNSRFPRNESPDSHRAQSFPCHLKTSVAWTCTSPWMPVRSSWLQHPGQRSSCSSSTPIRRGFVARRKESSFAIPHNLKKLSSTY